MPTTQLKPRAKPRDNPIDDLWRSIFGPKHEPKRVFKKRARHATIVVNHPTKKAARNGMIRTRLPLMADGLTHLDVTSEIIRMAEYPLVVTYQQRTASGQTETRFHKPDLAALYSDGRVIVIDYEPINIQKRTPKHLRDARREGVAEALAQLDASYVVQDEAAIYLQPRWTNVCEIWKHMQDGGQHPGIAALKTRILADGLPATIGQLMQRMNYPVMTSRSPDEPVAAAKILTEFNPTYTAVLQLAAAGEVRFDHSQPLSINAVVTRKV